MKWQLFFIAWLICSFPAYGFDACAPNAAQLYTQVETRSSRGLLFKIEKCGAEPSYIFGTMHVDMKEVEKGVYDAFDAARESSIALFEIETNPTLAADVQQAMMLPPEHKAGLAGIIGPDYFRRLLIALSSDGKMPADYINRLTPWAAAILLQLPPDEGDAVLDERLQHFAFSRQILVKSLETPQEQFAVFQQLPLPQQIQLLQDALDHKDVTDELNARMISAYKQKDLQTIFQLGEQSFAEIEDAQLETYLRDRLLTRRNALMVERAKPYLDRGDAFIAVGALHLPGPQGMLHLLEQKGYFIETMN